MPCNAGLKKHLCLRPTWFTVNQSIACVHAEEKLKEEVILTVSIMYTWAGEMGCYTFSLALIRNERNSDVLLNGWKDSWVFH